MILVLPRVAFSFALAMWPVADPFCDLMREDRTAEDESFLFFL